MSKQRLDFVAVGRRALLVLARRGMDQQRHGLLQLFLPLRLLLLREPLLRLIEALLPVVRLQTKHTTKPQHSMLIQSTQVAHHQNPCGSKTETAVEGGHRQVAVNWAE